MTAQVKLNDCSGVFHKDNYIKTYREVSRRLMTDGFAYGLRGIEKYFTVCGAKLRLNVRLVHKVDLVVEIPSLTTDMDKDLLHIPLVSTDPDTLYRLVRNAIVKMLIRTADGWFDN